MISVLARRLIVIGCQCGKDRCASTRFNRLRLIDPKCSALMLVSRCGNDESSVAQFTKTPAPSCENEAGVRRFQWMASSGCGLSPGN
jgi:hypothetical protein